MQSQRLDVLPFFWWYNAPIEGNPISFESCQTIPFGFGANPNSEIIAQPPYTLQVFPVGYAPALAAAFSDANGTFAEWNLNYWPSTQFLMQFVDANGYSGGVSPLTTVSNNGNGTNCNTDQSPSVVSMGTMTDAPPTCSQVDVSMVGGTPPYAITIAKAADQAYNITGVQETAQWTNDMTAGASYILSGCDSTGLCALIGSVGYSQGGSDTSCIATPAHSGMRGNSSKGAGTKILSALVGAGVAAGLLFLAGAFYFWRKRRRNQKEQGRKRASFTNTAPFNSLPGEADAKLRQSSPNSEKIGSAPGSKYATTRSGSVHSLQNLNIPAYKFRVLNPDVDDSAKNSPVGWEEFNSDRHDLASPATEDLRDDSDWTGVQSTAVLTNAKQSNARRRSGSLRAFAGSYRSSISSESQGWSQRYTVSTEGDLQDENPFADGSSINEDYSDPTEEDLHDLNHRSQTPSSR